MKLIEFIKKGNTILVFVLLIGALIFGSYLFAKLRKPVHVSVDSLHFGKK